MRRVSPLQKHRQGSPILDERVEAKRRKGRSEPLKTQLEFGRVFQFRRDLNDQKDEESEEIRDEELSDGDESIASSMQHSFDQHGVELLKGESEARIPDDLGFVRLGFESVDEVLRAGLSTF